MVGKLGSMSLKILLILFIIVNINKILSFRGFSKDNLPFLWIVVTMFISLVVNIETYSNIIIPINLFIAINIIYVVFSQEKGINKYIWCYAFSALFSAILCITTTDTISEYTFRRTGGTGDPNEFSVTVLISLSFLLGYMLKFRNKQKIAGIVVMLLFYVISLLFAGSKSAILTLILLVILFLGYICTSYKSSHKKLLITGIIFTFIVIGIVVGYYYGDVFQMLLQRFDEVGTANERFISWKAGLELFVDNPFCGIGIANYRNIIGIYYPFIAETSRAAHNMYIQALVETGFIGFVAYLGFIISILFKQLKYKTYPLEIVLGFISILLMGGTLSLLFDKYVWIFYAFLYNKNSYWRKYENSRNNTTTFIRWR
jgi:Lipid A core - O-antigen ligase and related enzymes